MNWEYILEVPFESKKIFMESDRAKYAFKGKVYYLLDSKGMVLRDFTQLEGESFEYRPNDNAMMIGNSGKGTDYWNSKGIKEFRLSNFENSPINKSVIVGDDDLMDSVNNEALENHVTALKMEGLLSGSNTSGADLRIDATPFWSVDRDFYGLKFVNAFKKLRVKRNNLKSELKYPITKSQLDNSVKMNLKEYFEVFKNHKRAFVDVNPEMISLLSKDEQEQTQKLYFLDLKSKIRNEMVSYENLANTLISKYNSDLIERQQLIDRLRGIFRNLLIIEHHIKGVSTIVDREEKISNMDAAHILDVHKIKKLSDKYLWKIADVNNGLLLPKDIHWKLDKDIDVKLTTDFKIINNNEVIYEVSKEYKTNSRMQYIKERNGV